jgi:hypothetical protein
MTSNLPQREAVARHLREWCRSFIGVRITAKEANESTDAILQIISSLQDRWRPPEGWKLVPVDALRWLHGEHDDGFERPGPHSGAFWWRSEFRRRCEAAPLPPIPSSLKGSDVGEVGE